MIKIASFVTTFLLLALLFAVPAKEALATAFDDPASRTAGGGGNGLVPVESLIDGGVISIGSTAQVVVLFRNEGTRNVSTGVINLYPSSNVSPTVTLNQCAQEPLPGGAECAVAISVKGLQAGPWRIEMLMRHDGRTRLVTSTLSGTVESTGENADQLISDIETIPNTLDYGSLSASRSQLRSIVLRNITSNAITVEDVFMRADETSGLSVDTDCSELAAGEACVVAVTWSPLTRGPSSGVVVVRHTGPTGISTVEISGEYTPETSVEAEQFPEAIPGKGLMISSLTEIDFEEDVDSTSSITTSLVNNGDAELTITDISLSGKDNGLRIEEFGCSNDMVLEPFNACPLTLSWSPVRTGTLRDDVTVAHSGARGILVIPVLGDADTAVDNQSQSILLSGGVSPGMTLDLEAIQISEEELGLDPISDPAARVPPPPPIVGTEPNITNRAKLLDGFSITSLANDRAIITSPNGTRLVFDREAIVIGGVQWTPYILSTGVEFHSGNDKVLMLFDRSLSSLNNSRRESERTSGRSSSSSENDD